MATSDAKKRPRRLSDWEIVEQFVAFLAANGRPGLRVERIPDREKSGEIDAIAADLAIEHTSIDTLAGERRDAARFWRLVEGLNEIQVSAFIRVIVPMHALQPGQDWVAMNAALRRWFQTEGQHLSDGEHTVDIPGIPFSMYVHQWDSHDSRTYGIIPARLAPHDNTLSDRVRAQVDRKLPKLRRHKNDGRRTVLLLESQDFSLMNPEKMATAVRAAYPDGKPVGIDEVWYVSSALPHLFQFVDFSAWTDDLGRPAMWQVPPAAA